MPDETVLSEELEKEADAKAKAAAGPDTGLGYCHAFWAAKKKILREEYGIDWESPAEEYPAIFFD